MITIKNNRVLPDSLLKILTLLVAVSSAFFFPKLGWWAADYFGFLFGYKQFSISWDIIHHIVQVLPVILIMLLPIFKMSLSEWGINNIEKGKNKQLIINFFLGFIVFFTIGKFIYMWLNGWPWILDFDQDVKSAWSVILFRLIMPGLSEELLFRAYVMTILIIAWKKVIHIGRINLPVAGIISALIFVMAHIGFSLFPFQIIYFNTGQLIFSFIFGIFYAIIFYETKSILVPIVTHNIVDGIGTLIDYLLTLIFIK